VIAQHPGDIPTSTLREICRQVEWERPPTAQEGVMTTRHYIVIADQEPGEEMWSILFPDFPGVASAACDIADVPQQARDALATAVEDMIAQGEPLPASVEDAGRTETDTALLANAHVLVVPVEVPDAKTGDAVATTAAC
jgi:predicted RNase H-like HicB family nuclease